MFGSTASGSRWTYLRTARVWQADYLARSQNTEEGCSSDVCNDGSVMACPAGLQCIDMWRHAECRFDDHFVFIRSRNFFKFWIQARRVKDSIWWTLNRWWWWGLVSGISSESSNCFDMYEVMEFFKFTHPSPHTSNHPFSHLSIHTSIFSSLNLYINPLRDIYVP